MPRTDLSPAELAAYAPEVAEPDDFDDFWAGTLGEAREHDLGLRVTPVRTPYRTVEVQDVTFAGFGGDPISAWLLRPTGVAAPQVVVEFLGYGGGRDLPGTQLHWASAGYTHLLVDTRGQGSVWGGGGTTADPHGSGPSAPGFLTKGVADPATYYYRRVFTDAVRAVEAARALPGVDPAAVAVTGGSQGGGITLAVAGLVPDLRTVMPDVPFLCHFERAVEICDRDPYLELTRYLSVHRGAAEQTFRTLSYFDGVNFARRASAPALFSVALMDQICPPSTVYAAYHAYAGPKEIAVYAFNDHEGGLSHQRLRQADWLAR